MREGLKNMLKFNFKWGQAMINGLSRGQNMFNIVYKELGELEVHMIMDNEMRVTITDSNMHRVQRIKKEYRQPRWEMGSSRNSGRLSGPEERKYLTDLSNTG